MIFSGLAARAITYSHLGSCPCGGWNAQWNGQVDRFIQLYSIYEQCPLFWSGLMRCGGLAADSTQCMRTMKTLVDRFIYPVFEIWTMSIILMWTDDIQWLGSRSDHLFPSRQPLKCTMEWTGGQIHLTVFDVWTMSIISIWTDDVWQLGSRKNAIDEDLWTDSYDSGIQYTNNVHYSDLWWLSSWQHTEENEMNVVTSHSHSNRVGNTSVPAPPYVYSPLLQWL